MNPHARRGVAGAAAVLAAAALWASIGVISVALFRMGVTPWEVAFWRAAIAALLLGAGVLVTRPRLLLPRRPADALLLAGFGAVGVGLFYISFQLAIAATSVAVAVVLLYTAPAWVVFGAAAVLGERLSAAKLAMVALVIAGVCATSLGAAGAEIRLTVAGVAWGLAAALSYATYYLFGKRYLPRFGITRTLCVSLASGALVIWAAAAASGHPPHLRLPPAAWALLIGLAVGTTLVANGLYYWGLARIEAGRAAVLASVEPVIAAILALALLGEGLTLLGWAGVGLVVVGVAVVPTLGGRRGDGAPAARAAEQTATGTAPAHTPPEP